MYKVFGFCLLIVIGYIQSSYANEKIVYLNVNYVFSNSISGKEANKSFESKVKNLENKSLICLAIDRSSVE